MQNKPKCLIWAEGIVAGLQNADQRQDTGPGMVCFRLDCSETMRLTVDHFGKFFIYVRLVQVSLVKLG